MDSLNNLRVIDSAKHVMSCLGSASPYGTQTRARLSLWGSSGSGIIQMNRTKSMDWQEGLGLVWFDR